MIKPWQLFFYKLGVQLSIWYASIFLAASSCRRLGPGICCYKAPLTTRCAHSGMQHLLAIPCCVCCVRVSARTPFQEQLTLMVWMTWYKSQTSRVREWVCVFVCVCVRHCTLFYIVGAAIKPTSTPNQEPSWNHKYQLRPLLWTVEAASKYYCQGDQFIGWTIFLAFDYRTRHFILWYTLPKHHKLTMHHFTSVNSKPLCDNE